ncbi:MAG: hypothetical protein K9L79_08180 [Methylobacter tundripaludum]|uniref:Uncharacterized protein n=1 Tax=Methylobacter tundripaludum TaxID=173365 RepID=A0A2S6GKD6_9GAMM|nr:hypothetical protein [Methylobacter tundripaludum]MCF7965503.1 hypothetical protein [Methylobacter tundripaludum]MCK9638091.1 hypothetical protein [Methylobacter tundripaludum]PPK65702.1 hypothetical protein B0F88_1194 [Methylobacter tundripaludum]
MSDANSLIYQNANTYRLHADNLRWVLLGGYATFLVGMLSTQNNILESPVVAIGLAAISFLYLLILAVQNWFYNLFARFVDECESRLASKENLRPLQEFAKEKGKDITPFHPAFYFALVIQPLGITIFLYKGFAAICKTEMPLLLWSAVFFAILLVMHFLFKGWNKFIYKGLIVKLSNLYA